MIIIILCMLLYSAIYYIIHNYDILSCNGQFSEFHVCFCGLDPGNLKFETVRTHKQHICFQDLRRSI